MFRLAGEPAGWAEYRLIDSLNFLQQAIESEGWRPQCLTCSKAVASVTQEDSPYCVIIDHPFEQFTVAPRCGVGAYGKNSSHP